MIVAEALVPGAGIEPGWGCLRRILNHDLLNNSHDSAVSGAQQLHRITPSF